MFNNASTATVDAAAIEMDLQAVPYGTRILWINQNKELAWGVVVREVFVGQKLVYAVVKPDGDEENHKTIPVSALQHAKKCLQV